MSTTTTEAAAPKKAGKKKSAPKKAETTAESATAPVEETSYIGGFLSSVAAFFGFGPTNPHVNAPTDYVRLKGQDLMHAVNADADEARTQGKQYIDHVKNVVAARNRLKANAIDDARHVISRWEALAEQAAIRIAALPADQQETASTKEMTKLVIAVETEFRAIVPSDIAQMAEDLSVAIQAGTGTDAIRDLVASIGKAKAKAKRSAIAMAGGDKQLEATLDGVVPTAA